MVYDERSLLAFTLVSGATPYSGRVTLSRNQLHAPAARIMRLEHRLQVTVTPRC